jgi:hypothetical protein
MQAHVCSSVAGCDLLKTGGYWAPTSDCTMLDPTVRSNVCEGNDCNSSQSPTSAPSVSTGPSTTLPKPFPCIGKRSWDTEFIAGEQSADTFVSRIDCNNGARYNSLVCASTAQSLFIIIKLLLLLLLLLMLNNYYFN